MRKTLLWLITAVLIFCPLLMGAKSCGSTAGMAPAYTSCGHLERLWVHAGGNSADANFAAAIAMAESSGNKYAITHEADGTTSIGYWQINSTHGQWYSYNGHVNAEGAVAISGDGSNWNDGWATTMSNGHYHGFCGIP
jgi:hypothetical protein